MLFRLEYNVFNLADKLGMKAPHRVPSYSDEDWINVLEEVTPYMERQWSSPARAKDEELIAYPEDALEPMQRFALRERYVQLLESQITSLVCPPTLSAPRTRATSRSSRRSPRCCV